MNEYCVADAGGLPLDAGACDRCRRRSWLLGELSGPLDYLARDRQRLDAALALPDMELIQAAGGRRRAQLATRYDAFERGPNADAATCFCRHHASYPRELRDAGAPAVLHTTPSVMRLLEIINRPVVAIVGSATPSDYGITMAAALGRGLAASGVTVAGSAVDGVPLAGMAAALQAGAAPLAVVGHGLEVSAAIRRRLPLRDIAAAGCVVSELPSDCGGRRWGAIAAARILARLAAVTVVVEAEDTVGGLWAARMAQSRGARVAAVPGRVTSRLAGGANVLLMEGAPLVRDAEDVLAILCLGDAAPIARTAEVDRGIGLNSRLRDVLDLVGDGCDTPASLAIAGVDRDTVLQSLTELEVIGLLRRGEGGRYVPTEPFRAPTYVSE